MMQNLVMDIVKNGAASAIVNGSGVVQKVLPLSETNLLTKSLLNGVSYSVAYDGVNYLTEGRSKYINLDVYGIVDDVFLLSSVFAVADVSGLGKSAYNALKQVSPIDNTTVLASVIDGGIITIGKVLNDHVQRNSDVNPILRNVTQVSRLIRPSA